MDNTWTKISGLPEHYEVNRSGDVRSTTHERSTGGAGRCQSKGKTLKPYMMKSGHLYFNYSGGSLRGRIFVHHAVARTFIPNPNRYPIINHIDGNPANNAEENLEWCTHKHNSQHMWYVLKIQKNKVFRGEDNVTSKLNDEKVRFIRENRRKITRAKMAEMLGVSRCPIDHVLDGKSWRHVV